MSPSGHGAKIGAIAIGINWKLLKESLVLIAITVLRAEYRWSTVVQLVQKLRKV